MKPSFDNPDRGSNPASTTRRRRPGLGVVTLASLLLALFTVVPTRAQVVITEFMAAAEFSIPDQDGEPSDWVEVTNRGASAVSLAGYSLTSNPADLRRWIFPSVNLNAGSSLVVYATGKNRTNPASQLHLNFTLDSGGNYLALVAPDGTTIVSAFAPGYPEQFPTISYGVDGTNGVTLGYFYTPTPGAPNGSVKGLPPAEIVFSDENKMITTGFNLTLSCATPGVTIRYTTNLSEPTSSSTIYTAPIAITSSRQIRARAFLSGCLDGPVGMRTFLKMSGTVPSFSSNLPIVVHSTLNGAIPPSSGSTTRIPSFFFIFEPNPATGRTTLSQIPNLTTRCGVRKRGNSSATEPKYSMAIECWKSGGIDVDRNGSISTTEEQDRTIKPFGMPAEADWILAGRYTFDLALMRNPFMYDLSRQVGRYAARYRYVELYNDVDGGDVTDSDYFGIYEFMERIEVDPNRVDIAKLDKWENTLPNVTGGYIFKQDWLEAGSSRKLDVPNSGDAEPLIPSDPDSDDLTAAQETYLEGYLSEMVVALRNAPSGINPTTGRHFTDYLDVDSFIDYHCLNILTENLDWGRHSTNYYKDRNGVVFAGPIWDYDRALGSEDGRDENPYQWDAYDPRGSKQWFDSRFPWFGYLLGPTSDRTTAYYIDIRQRHTDRWFELRKGAFSVANLQAKIDGLASQIREAAPRNFTKWSALPLQGPYPGPLTAVPPAFGGAFQGPAPVGGWPNGWEKEVAHMKGWVAARAGWIDQQYLTPPTFNTPDASGLVLAGFSLTMSSPSGPVYFTTNGSDPRAPGGAPAAGATLFTGSPVTVNSGNVIMARSRIGLDWSAPARVVVSDELANATNLVVAEIMYNPASASAADITAGFTNSDLFEYLELLNISSTPIALVGMVFAEGIEFNFNDSPITFLQPGGRVLVVKNQAAFVHRYGSTYANRIAGEFQNDTNLRNSGEQLILNAYGGGLLREFSYKENLPWPQAADGAGYSLILIAPETNPNHGLAPNWRSSVALGGNPGYSDTIGWATWAANNGGIAPGSDNDHDSRDAFTEYALHGNPNVSDAPAIQVTMSTVSLTVATIVDEYLVLQFPRNLASDDVEVVVQSSGNLVTWEGAGMVLVEEINHGDGSATLRYRSAVPYDHLPSASFYRLHMSLR